MDRETKLNIPAEAGRVVGQIIRLVALRPVKSTIVVTEESPREEPLPPVKSAPAEPIQQKMPSDLVRAPAEEETIESSEAISTGCLSCSRSHLSTVSGALGEALRFARDELGIKDPEVQRRIMLAEDELNIMERIDLAPDALMQSPPEERQVAEEYLPRIRELRQRIGDIGSVDQLTAVAGEASVLGQEFRLRHLQLKGVDLNPIVELAKAVDEGEITMEEAKEKMKDLLPEGS